jgi:uncharacterized repeat protein (TIGR03806 family)
MKFLYLIAGWLSLLGSAGTPAAGSDVLPPVAVDVTAAPAPYISAYHLFRDIARHLPNEGVVPYEVNTPLFSDYAEKHRYVYLPPGRTAEYREAGTLAFPVGTVLVKTFSFPRDRRDPAKGERIIETRLLMHRPEGWVGYPYVWKEDLSDARLAVAGARLDISWTHDDGTGRATRYKIPNMNECKQCHANRDVMGPLGPSARQLNRDFSYDAGSANQLSWWAEHFLLAGLPEGVKGLPRLPVWNDPTTGTLDERARAYLDVNCAHCHNPNGEAASTGLDLTWGQHEPVAFGVNKLPTAAGPASRGYKYAITPGKPRESFLLSRLRAIDPAKMMPRTGRSLPHDEGVALLEAWIAAMDPAFGSETRYGTAQ